MSECGTCVWTGRALQAGYDDLEMVAETSARSWRARARTLPYAALTAAQAARTARCRRVGTQARWARALLQAHVCGPRPLHGLPVARRMGCALARDRPREPRPLCGPVVDVQRAPPRPAPGSTRRHPFRLHRPAAP